MYWRQVLAQTTHPKLSTADAKLINAMGKDLATGIPGLMTQSLSGWEPKKLWRAVEGNGRSAFEECAFVEGFDSRADGRSLVAADFDGDGDLELLMLNRDAPKLQLFSNVGQGGNAVAIALVPKTGNREAEGAIVRTSRGVFPVALARGYASSVEPQVHLGLGNDKKVDVEVQWRSGAREKFPGLEAGHTYWLPEGAGKARRVPFATRAAAPRTEFPSTLAALGLEPHEGLTVVQLFLHDCKPCADEAPELNRLAKSGRVRVVGLGLHPEGEALTAAAKSLKLEYPVKPLKDALADALSTGGQLPLPILLVFTRDGKLARVLPGPKALEAVLNELGAPVR